MATLLLLKEFKNLSKDPNYFYSCVPNPDNILMWNFCMIGPPDTLYEYGTFTGKISFPPTYPLKPPQVIFDNIIHPNIHKNGVVCISILHEGTDFSGYEHENERWRPSHNINTIMLSVLSLLSSPNFDSPANLDAKILWQDNIEEYKKIIYDIVKKSNI
jgi:ubiquitin-protein ligase